MKHAMSAAIALALGLGLATAAQAHGNYRQSALPNGNTQAGTAATMQEAATPRKARHIRMARVGTSRQQIRQVQLALKQDGLYKGKATGVMNRPTKLALSRFEKQNGLRQTTQINRTLLSRLEGNRNTGNQAVGVGSSMPRNGNRNQAGAANMNPTMPPANTPPSAGGNTGTTTPSNTDNTATQSK